MAYTMEQYQQDHLIRKLPQFLDDDEMRDKIFKIFIDHLPTDKLISLFSTDDILLSLVASGHLPLEVVVPHLSIDKRLEGIPLEYIEAHLQKIQQTTDD